MTNFTTSELNQRLDKAGVKILNDGQQIITALATHNLNWKTSRVLKLLLQNIDEIITRDEFINKVWESNFSVGDKAIGTAIWNLRNYFKGTNIKIETAPKKGYRLILLEGSLGTPIKQQNMLHLNPSSQKIFNVIFATLVITGIYFYWQVQLENKSVIEIEDMKPSIKIAVLSRIVGPYKPEALQNFIIELEQDIPKSSGLELVTGDEKNQLLASSNHEQSGALLGVSYLLYLELQTSENAAIAVSGRLISIDGTSFETWQWQENNNNLQELKQKILSILPVTSWQ